MRAAAVVLAALCFVVAAGVPRETRASAQELPALTSVTLSPAVATVGDKLNLEVVVEGDAAFTVEGPGFGEDFGDLELLDVREPVREQDGDISRTTLGYTLTSFVTGTQTLPPLSIVWSGPGGDGRLATPEQPIDVKSVLAPGDVDLRPLKPQLEIAETAPPAIVPLLYVAIFAVLTVFGYVLVARAIGERPWTKAPAPAVPLTPAQAARAELDVLAAAGVADIRAHYAQIAEILRRYLSARFRFPAHAMTRRELQRHMAVRDIDRWPARVTSNLLEQSDAVIFAGFDPAPERIDADLTAAYEIIDLTAPADERMTETSDDG